MMTVHYLEIVSPEADAICSSYEAVHDVQFGKADDLLGGARTCTLSDGTMIGVRRPLRETEDPVIRPYWLVDDIEEAIGRVKAKGADIAMPPSEIPGRGKFAIYIIGSVEHGLWQR